MVEHSNEAKSINLIQCPHPECDCETLLSRIRDTGQSIYGVLSERYRPWIRTGIRKANKGKIDLHDLEDAENEVHIRIMETIATWPKEINACKWVLTIAVRTATDMIRWAGRKRRNPTGQVSANLFPDIADPHENDLKAVEARNERIEAFKTAVETLTEEEKVICDRISAGIERKEIAKELGVSLRTYYKTQKRIFNRIRERIKLDSLSP